MARSLTSDTLTTWEEGRGQTYMARSLTSDTLTTWEEGRGKSIFYYCHLASDTLTTWEEGREQMGTMRIKR